MLALGNMISRAKLDGMREIMFFKLGIHVTHKFITFYQKEALL
jgi:hypothetical protein